MTVVKAAESSALLLLGLSRSGKTTVGAALARQLSRPFFDTDSCIKTETGMSPRELYCRDGAAAFYDAEYRALAFCLEQSSGQGRVADGIPLAVIAAGGGICDNPRAAEAADLHPYSIFLQADEGLLFERLTRDAEKTGTYPPFLGSLSFAEKAAAQKAFAALYARRSAWYAAKRRLTVETTDLSVQHITEKIMQLVREGAFSLGEPL